jgi:hypothetical protein
LNDQDEAWFDPGGGRQAWESPRQYQKLTIEILIGKSKMDLHMEPRESKGPEANEVGLSKVQRW